ncbi:FtsX-like permease family protein [Actinoplanes sp. NPDC020271]|uniref:FtsX-like permease family protein n=1 Tax=Actinoplanes sp. NPDC020271 TaxID=3363896 RepID=UPI003794D95B
MIALLLRRARAQWPVLVALLAVVTLGATLLGVCALLVTRTAPVALAVAAQQADPQRLSATAYTSAIAGKDARSVTDATREVLTRALEPFPSTSAVRASSVMRELPGRDDKAQAYLSGVEDLPDRAALVTGRWPRAGADPRRPETVLLEPTAKLLGLTVGSKVRLKASVDSEAPAPAVDLTVVGIARPAPGAGWDRDLLDGAGFDPNHNDGTSLREFPAYGPFLVDLGDLLAGGSSLLRMEITARPDVASATPARLNTAARNVLDADARLTGTLGERAQFTRVASDLPYTLRTARNQQDVTQAAVLAVAVLGTVLTAAALALAGRLTAGLRSGETALLSALGTSRVQLAVTAALEAGLITLVSGAVAVPGSSLLHAALSQVAPMSGAGLTTGPLFSATQIVTVLAGALVLTVVLTLTALRAEAPHGRRGRRELLARSGADLLLVAFAGLGWWQLHAQRTDADVLQVLAPGLLLAAGAALALRLVPPTLRLADRRAARSDSLPLPLAVFEAARRPRAAAAGLLICLAAATGTFGVALAATWDRSQHDQADLAVGTDLALNLTTPPVTGQGATIAQATGARVVSPATDRGIAIGQWLGGQNDIPQLVAVDTTHAGELLRGRLPSGQDWASATRGLVPANPVTGIPVAAGVTLTASGTATGRVPLTAAPQLLMQDAAGLRSVCAASPFPLDGKPHPITGCAPVDGMTLVAVALPVDYDFSYLIDAGGTTDFAVTLRLPGPVGGAAAWHAVPAENHGSLIRTGLTTTGNGLTVTGTAQLNGNPLTALALDTTAFQATRGVPVLVSQKLADGLSVSTGSSLELTVGTTAVPVTIAGVVPGIPGAPGAAAVLADIDAVSRALTLRGDLVYPADAWWAAAPARTDLADLHLGEATTRAGETRRLTSGPLNAGLPAVLRLLVPAAVLLLLAGVILHVTHDLRDRAVEVARLRGLGMTGREIRTTLLGQHGAILLPLLIAGTLVGGLATVIVAPLLIRSETGATPVPSVLPSWPWPAELLLIALLVTGCTLAVGAVATVQARRAGAAQLRVVS